MHFGRVGASLIAGNEVICWGSQGFVGVDVRLRGGVVVLSGVLRRGVVRRGVVWLL